MFNVPTSSDGVSSNFLLAQDPIAYYDFQAGGLNPNVESYTQAYYDFVGAESVTTIDQITGIGAAVNGDRTDNVYSIWYNSGRQYNGYSKSDASQFRFTGSASADINDHAIQFGFEYEQRDDRYYGIGPVGLWTLAEQKVNNYIGQFEGAYEYLYTDAENGALVGVQNLSLIHI